MFFKMIRKRLFLNEFVKLSIKKCLSELENMIIILTN